VEERTKKTRIQSHEDLEVWHRAMALAVAVYRATESMPKSETYGLTGQIRRSAVSVAANIAEGSARRTTRDLMHFLTIARGSLRETQTYLSLIERLSFQVQTDEASRLSNEVGRQLSALMRSLRESSEE
jgi:four helix bundle protein